MLFRTKKPLLVAWRHRLLGYVPLLYQTRFVFIICSLFLTPSYSYTRPGLYLLYVLCSWLRPSLIPDQVCIYYMFSVLDPVLLLYQTRFVFIIFSLFLTLSYSYTRPGWNLLYVLCSWLRPTLIPDQVCIYYMFSVLDSVLLLYQSCRFIYHNEFSFLDSVLLSLISDLGNIFSFHYNFTLSYSYIRPGSNILFPWLRPTLISDQVNIFSILDSVLL